MTSRMDAASVNSITKRSIPMPSPTRRGHAVLQRFDIVLIHQMRIQIAFLTPFNLLEKTSLFDHPGHLAPKIHWRFRVRR